MMEEKERLIAEALHNLGYRCIGRTDAEVVFGKPIGYGILRADILIEGTKAKLEVMLIVKGKATDAKPAENLVFRREKCTLPSDGKCADYYLEASRFVSDSEALIMRSPVNWVNNRFLRYDFKENNSILLDLLL